MLIYLWRRRSLFMQFSGSSLLLTEQPEVINNSQTTPTKTTMQSLTRFGNRLRRMDFVVLRSIVGRARHELDEFEHGGYSRSDKLRKRRYERYQYLSAITISLDGRIPCDLCNSAIHFNSFFFIQKRKSYNKYYHHSCASSLNMCY